MVSLLQSLKRELTPTRAAIRMITGYNTDVTHSNQVFHVQTEDKGVAIASIESLVYVGGQILGKRRTSYRSMLDRAQAKKAIIDLMDRQHRLMIAEIRSGKYDAQLQASAAPPAREEVPEVQSGEFAARSKVVDKRKPAAPAVVEDPAAALAGSPLEGEGQTLDQIILEYLNSEAEQEHLILMMEVDREFALGQSTSLKFRTKGSMSGKPIPNTRVSVKMISTVAEPLTLAYGETDGEGAIELALEIPDNKRGSSALIVTASSEIGTAEIKHLL